MEHLPYSQTQVQRSLVALGSHKGHEESEGQGQIVVQRSLESQTLAVQL